MRSSSAASGSAPGCENTTTFSRKIISVGIDMMPNAPPSSCWASVSTLREHEVGVRRRGLLEHGRELPARAAPGRPEVDQHDVVLGDGRFEVVVGQLDGGHARLLLRRYGNVRGRTFGRGPVIPDRQCPDGADAPGRSSGPAGRGGSSTRPSAPSPGAGSRSRSGSRGARRATRASRGTR